MNRALAFLQSSIGRKVVMAVTGAVLVSFVIGHMLGNLQAFLGAQVFNDYAASLRKIPALLWGARIGLLIAAILHIWAAWSLTQSNNEARPEGYREKKNEKASLASTTMRISGVVVLAFLVYHLLHLTFGTVHPDFKPHDAFHNFVAGFKNPLASGAYIVGMVLLGFHLWHGVWSWMQSLGLNHPRYNHLRNVVATLVTVAVVGANIVFPLAVLAGIIHE